MIHFEVSGNTPFGAAALVDAQVQGFPAMVYAFNGTTFDRIRSNSAANLALVTQSGALLAADPGEWVVVNTVATNVQATATKAAGGAGVRHVLRSFGASMFNTAAAAGSATIFLRDGATGVGTVLYAFDIAIPAVSGTCLVVVLSGLNIVGSANTAMTFEFSGAGGANTVEKVSMSGYSTI